MSQRARKADPDSDAHPDLPVDDSGRARCWWCVGDPLYRDYHDSEWGNPVTDDVTLFEKVCLEGFQCGLSWLTILKRREAFREVFAGFDFERVSKFKTKDVARLVRDARIIRHRGKIEATIHNASRAIEMRREFDSLAHFFWQFEPDPEVRRVRQDIPATSKESIRMSRALKKRGWKFVGPTTCYALMQAMGMVNDHLEGCGQYARIEKRRRSLRRPVCRDRANT